jgi:hypothetical protein
MLNGQHKTTKLSTVNISLHFVTKNKVTADVKQVKPEIAMSFITLKIKVKITLSTDPSPPSFLKLLCCLEGSQTLPLYRTGKGNT